MSLELSLKPEPLRCQLLERLAETPQLMEYML